MFGRPLNRSPPRPLHSTDHRHDQGAVIDHRRVGTPKHVLGGALTNHRHNEEQIADDAKGEVDPPDDLGNSRVLGRFSEKVLRAMCACGCGRVGVGGARFGEDCKQDCKWARVGGQRTPAPFKGMVGGEKVGGGKRENRGRDDRERERARDSKHTCVWERERERESEREGRETLILSLTKPPRRSNSSVMKK